MEKIPFTPQGLETIKEELAHLKGHERQAVINAIAEAREHGDGGGGLNGFAEHVLLLTRLRTGAPAPVSSAAKYPCHVTVFLRFGAGGVTIGLRYPSGRG